MVIFTCPECENKTIMENVFDKPKHIASVTCTCGETTHIGGPKNDDVNKLNEYIDELKINFPEYQYVNMLSEKDPASYAFEDKFTIIVRGVSDSTDIFFYIKNTLYDRLLDTDEILPGIVYLEERTDEQ